jgi:hypothetical protein
MYYDPLRSSQRDCNNSNKSNDELVKVSGRKSLRTHSTQSSLNDASTIPTLRVKGNRNRIIKSDDLSSSENVVRISAKQSRTAYELSPVPVQSEIIAPSLDETKIKDGAFAMPQFAASFAASSTASRDSQLMMMLFAQELERTNQRFQELDRKRSNELLMQTMAFIANNK